MVAEKLKARFLIAGLGLLAFGLGNFFRYLPISHSPAFWNTPFPFTRLYDVVHYEGKGTGMTIGYMPLDEAVNDPYWLFWSLVFYAGIIITGLVVWRRR